MGRSSGALLVAFLSVVVGVSCAAAGPSPGAPQPGEDAGAPLGTTGPTPPPGAPGGTVTYGAPYEGGEFHLGPVDYDESQFHNACAPGTKYSAAVRSAQGTLLAGLWGGLPDVGQYCDACILVKTEKGKSAVLRVVTYGDTTKNSIDVSPEAFAILDSGEHPRHMTWQLTNCPATGKAMYEVQTGAHEYWTSLWLRNVSVPVAKVEVKSQNHASFVALRRGGDGTLTDDAGFGKGPFTLKVTLVDGRSFEDSYAWPSDGIGGKLLVSTQSP